MRIAFVPAARVLSDREANGESLIAVSLLRALAARGHDVLAYCERADIEIPGVEIREVSADGPTVALGRLAFARRIARDVADERIDVAHVLFPFTTHEGYAFTEGAPVVCGPVNLPWPAGKRRARIAARIAALYTNRAERRAHRRTLARAARILVTGESSRRAISERLRERCTEIPFGVDLARFAATPLPAEPTIVFLSVLQDKKGIEVLLRAMPLVLQRSPRARLVVAGSDPDNMRPRLERLVRELGIEHAVSFAGPVAPADAPALYASARVVCQPSYGEPFGMTVVEAMACGRPVVGTDDGGIRDAIIDRQGGRLVRPGDPILLADALGDVLERYDEAERMGTFNRRRVEERYALDVVVDRIEETYRAVTGTGAHVRA